MTAGKNANVSWFLNFRLSVRPGETTARRVRKFLIQEKTWKRVADSYLLYHAIYTVSYCFIVLALIKLFSVTERTQESLQKHSEKAKPEYQAFQTGLRERKFRLASDKQLRRAGSYPGGTPLQKPLCVAPWGRVLVLLAILVWYRGCGFRRNCGSVWTYLSFQFQMSKKKREIYEFEFFLFAFYSIKSR